MKKERESRFAAKNNSWMVRQFKHLWKLGVIQCFSKFIDVGFIFMELLFLFYLCLLYF